MKRLLLFLFLLPGLCAGQSWTGILAPARGFDWSAAGLPATFPDGETTTNPWTPPTRTPCVTAACNIVAGGTVTATTITNAYNSAPAGTYIPTPSGTFALGGTVNVTASNVTLRGAGAASTKLTGGDINFGNNRSWGGASFLTSNPTKGATTIQVSAPPSGGRLAMLEQCDDGFSSPNAAGMTHFVGAGYANPCTGSYSDPIGPWLCGLNSICNRNGGGTGNPHFQTEVVWISSVVGSTITLSSPIANANWSTARSAVLTWLTVNGAVGSGVEDLTIEGGVNFIGTYACWAKGVRLITTSATAHQIQTTFDSHTLVFLSYIAATQGGSGASRGFFGSDSGEQGSSFYLILGNIIDGGYLEGNGGQTGGIVAYNYHNTAGNTGFQENGIFEHHAGTSFLLDEGNQYGYSLDDDTWGTHNFNTRFRNHDNCTDNAFPAVGSSSAVEIGGWARFDHMIGNILGRSGSACTTYGNTFSIDGRNLDGGPTGLTAKSLMNWGNYVICSGDARCNTASFLSGDVPSNLASFGANSIPYQNPVPLDHVLPASFFMNGMGVHPAGGTGLTWWKACTGWSTFPTSCGSTSTPPMPPIGPEVTGGPFASGHAYSIPAALVFAALPDDSAYPTAWGHLKKFDRELAFQNDPGGGNPFMQISPSSSTFPDTTVGQTGGTVVVTLRNIGSADMTISALSVGGDFSITNNTCGTLPATVTVGLSCLVNVTFRPTQVGARGPQLLTVTDNAAGSPHTMTLNGNGVPPTAPQVRLFAQFSKLSLPNMEAH